MSQLITITRNGERIYLSTLEMLRIDNLRFGRIATVKKIETKLNITHASESQAILSWFSQCCWPLLATASQDYLAGKIDKAALLEVMKEADCQCGSCGCEFDALYKKVIAILSQEHQS